MNTSKMTDPMQVVEERLAPALREARQRLGGLDRRAQNIIRANPAATLIGAVAVGYLVGRLVSR